VTPETPSTYQTLKMMREMVSEKLVQCGHLTRLIALEDYVNSVAAKAKIPID
jgi:hypothetical protein